MEFSGTLFIRYNKITTNNNSLINNEMESTKSKHNNELDAKLIEITKNSKKRNSGTKIKNTISFIILLFYYFNVLIFCFSLFL